VPELLLNHLVVGLRIEKAEPAGSPCQWSAWWSPHCLWAKQWCYNV